MRDDVTSLVLSLLVQCFVGGVALDSGYAGQAGPLALAAASFSELIYTTFKISTQRAYLPTLQNKTFKATFKSLNNTH